MFDNIGGKIKGLATIICILGMIGSAIGAIALWVNGEFIIGLVILVAGCLTSWVGSFFAYGLGQMIENTDLIREALGRSSIRVAKPTNVPQKLTDARRAAVSKTQEHDQAHKATSAASFGITGWTCPHCQFVNISNKEKCTYCGRDRQTVPTQQPDTQGTTKRTEATPPVKTEITGWTCPKCQFFNTSNKDKCSYCGTEKQ